MLHKKSYCYLCLQGYYLMLMSFNGRAKLLFPKKPNLFIIFQLHISLQICITPSNSLLVCLDVHDHLYMHIHRSYTIILFLWIRTFFCVSVDITFNKFVSIINVSLYHNFNGYRLLFIFFMNVNFYVFLRRRHFFFSSMNEINPTVFKHTYGYLFIPVHDLGFQG
jgi:hypothetical protein